MWNISGFKLEEGYTRLVSNHYLQAYTLHIKVTPNLKALLLFHRRSANNSAHLYIYTEFQKNETIIF